MVQILAEDLPSDSTVKKWAAEFKWCKDSTEDDSQFGCPKIPTTDEQVDTIYHMVLDERHLTV